MTRLRAYLRRQIPSMFHRRLLLLLAGGVVVAVVLGAQTARLTLGEHHQRSLTQVESALSETRLIETVRGEIRDRRGRLLAHDEPGYDVAVDYRVISGEWADNRALRDARRAHRHAWPELSPDERADLAAEHRVGYERQMEELWQTLADLGRIERVDLERRKNQIVRRVHIVARNLQAIWWYQRSLELGEPVPFGDVAQPIAEQRQAHSVLEDIDQSTRLTIETFRAEAREEPALAVWRHVEIRRPKQRQYPNDTFTLELDRTHLPAPLRRDEPVEITVAGVGAHIIGQMRDVWREDTTGPGSRPFDPDSDLGGYLPGDRLGRFGFEAALERRLRGSRGRELRELDTGETHRIEPTAGEDVRLTLDIELQAQVQAIMSPDFGLMVRQPWHGDASERVGEPLRGAAVVLHIESGEVLAAVSAPTLPRGEWRNDPVTRPHVNRPIAQRYEPGSTIKPMALVAAVTEGIHPVDEPIVCAGHLYENVTDRYRCWIYRQYDSTHGPLGGPEAIARSCNIYFYQLGRDLGLSRLREWYGRFGIGAPTGVGLGEESRGSLPRLTSGPNARAEATLLGIGQGPVMWTPVQAAYAYALLVGEGEALPPTLVKDAHRDEPREVQRHQFHPLAVQRAIEGLDEAVNESYGTGHQLNLTDAGYDREPMFDLEHVEVYGKSGTAQAHPLRIDTTGDGRPDTVADQGSHGWFVALPRPHGASRPTHVVVVVAEYGGSGSLVTGPIAHQIIRALDREGYL